MILSTPIRDDFEDFVAWQFDQKGLFSVKSAYKLFVRQRDGPAATSSIQDPGCLKWEKIWSMPCVPKLKQFVWRLAHNSLPVKRNIDRRGIECDTLCVCCRRLDEDGSHLFLKCKQVKHLWRRLELEHVRDQMCTLPNSERVVQKILELNSDKQILLCCTLWRWWLGRNKLNSEGQSISVEEILRQARYWAAESLLYLEKDKTNTEKSLPGQQCWEKPPMDVIKLNADGAFQASTKSGG